MRLWQRGRYMCTSLSHLSKLFPSLTDNRSEISFLKYHSSSYTLQTLSQRPEERGKKKSKLSNQKKRTQIVLETWFSEVLGTWSVNYSSCELELCTMSKDTRMLLHKIVICLIPFWKSTSYLLQNREKRKAWCGRACSPAPISRAARVGVGSSCTAMHLHRDIFISLRVSVYSH